MAGNEVERALEAEALENEEAPEALGEDWPPALEKEGAFALPQAIKRQKKGAKARVLFRRFMALSYLIALCFAIIAVSSKETNHLYRSGKWEGGVLL